MVIHSPTASQLNAQDPESARSVSGTPPDAAILTVANALTSLDKNLKGCRETDMRLPPLTSGVPLAVRAAAAAGISLACAHLLKLEYPIYALIAAVLVTDLSHSKTSQPGLQRIVNTFVGATCIALFSPSLPSGPWGVGLGVCLTMLLSRLLGLQDSAIVAGYVCGIVVLAHRTEPWAYALYRFIETILGIGAAGLISLVPRLLESKNS